MRWVELFICNFDDRIIKVHWRINGQAAEGQMGRVGDGEVELSLWTNSACEDEYMLVRKKQCLEILNPGCGTCLYDEMSSSLGYWTSSPQAFVRYINKGGTYLFLQIILPFIHFDQIRYFLSRPPC